MKGRAFLQRGRGIRWWAAGAILLTAGWSAGLASAQTRNGSMSNVDRAQSLSYAYAAWYWAGLRGRVAATPPP